MRGGADLLKQPNVHCSLSIVIKDPLCSLCVARVGWQLFAAFLHRPFAPYSQ